MKPNMAFEALALAATMGLCSGAAFAAETHREQTIIRNGEQAAIKGPHSFSPATFGWIPCTPPTTICDPAAEA